VDLVAGGAGGHGRPPGPQGGLPLHQLAHEVEVGADDGAQRLDGPVRVDHGLAARVHEVGDHDGGGARDAGVAVDQHSLRGVAAAVDKSDGLGEVLGDVLEGGVEGGEGFGEEGRRDGGGAARHCQHPSDAVGLQQRQVLGIPGIAQIEVR